MGDNGEVLQGLNAKWTFLGATLIEWGCGMVMFFIISLFGKNPVQAMPMMLLGMFMTTMFLASLRKIYPDEERGVRNAFMSACGIAPPDIPAPALLQPIWSQAPLKELNETKLFVELGFSEMFPSFEEVLLELDAMEEYVEDEEQVHVE